MKITLQSHPYDAPGCVKLVAQDGRTILIQIDYDFPAVALAFGWNNSDDAEAGACLHTGTDGTVDCPSCNKTASDFIAEARAWLDAHDGAIAEDPCYF